MIRIIGTRGKYDQRRLWNKSFIQKSFKIHWTKTIENGGKSHYEINVFLKYMLDTIIGTPRNYFE